MRWKKWFFDYGPKLLKKLGIQEKDRVLEFGSGPGDYSIPLGYLVGNEGKVIAIDKEQHKIDKITNRKSKYGLNNLIILKTDGSLDFDIESNSMDKCFVFDVLHFLDKDSRKKIYGEFKRILKPSGLFITFPNHNKESMPGHNFKDLTFKDIIEEIKGENMILQDTFEGKLLHAHKWCKGKVLIFKFG